MIETIKQTDIKQDREGEERDGVCLKSDAY